MRGLITFCLMLCAIVTAAQGATYEWRDDKGVVNFTDDPSNVPAKFRNKVKIRESVQGVEPPAPPPAVERQPAAETRGERSEELYGGHSEAWWRNNYTELRKELKNIQDNLPGKKERLTALHRKRVMYQKPSDRVAYNELNDEIEKDEARITDLQGKIAALDDEATKAGVPQSLRQ